MMLSVSHLFNFLHAGYVHLSTCVKDWFITNWFAGNIPQAGLRESKLEIFVGSFVNFQSDWVSGTGRG